MSVTTRNPFDLLGNDGEEAAAAPAPAPAASAPKEIVAKQTTSRKRDATRPSAGESRRQAESSNRGGAGGAKKGSRPNSSSNALAGNDNATRPVEPVDGQASTGARRGRGGARGG